MIRTVMRVQRIIQQKQQESTIKLQKVYWKRSSTTLRQAGIILAQKLVAPQETGTYEIGLAVRDEYGAWSDWTW